MEKIRRGSIASRASKAGSNDGGNDMVLGEGSEGEMLMKTIPRQAIKSLFPKKEIIYILTAYNSPAAQDPEYIALVLESEKNKVIITKIVKSSGSIGYDIHKKWKLSDLHVFNVVNESTAVTPSSPALSKKKFPFSLKFDKFHTWYAESNDVRREFFATLYRTCKTYLKEVPLTNFNLTSEEEESNNELFMSRQGNDDDEIMSKKEEEDLVKILGDDITGDIDGVYNQLTAKVEELEISNANGLLFEAPEISDEVCSQVLAIARGLNQTTEWISQYEVPLRKTKHYIEHIEDTNNKMDLITHNQRELLNKLNDLIESVNLDKVKGALETANFEDVANIETLVESAQKVEKIVTFPVDPCLVKMSSVTEQIVYAKKLIKDFSHKLGKFMVNLFKETAVIAEKSRKTAKEKGKIEAHIELLKSHLNPYKSLVNWVKKVSEPLHATLIESYVQNESKIYKKLLKDFYSSVRLKIGKERKRVRELISSITFDSNEKSLDPDWILLMDALTQPEEEDYGLNGISVIQAFKEAYVTTMTVVKTEIQWMNEFFGEESATQEIMEELYGNFVDDIKEFVDSAEKEDPFNIISILIDTDAYLNDPFIFVQFKSTLIQQDAKCRFSVFIDSQEKEIVETQINIRRCHVASHFAKFIYFIKYLEESLERKCTLETIQIDPNLCTVNTVQITYAKLIKVLFDWLAKTPNPYKEPLYECLLLTENHYFFFNMLEKKIINKASETSKVKFFIDLIKGYASESKAIYEENSKLISKKLISRDFDELIHFFGLIKEMSKTIPYEEIQFRKGFSKSDCLSVIKTYDYVTIEKGFISTLKYINKHLGYNEELYKVQWNRTVTMFINKYEKILFLMKSCYSSSQAISIDQVKLSMKSVWDKISEKRTQKKPKVKELTI